MPFDEDKALHLPAHSWQSVRVTIPYGAPAALYVRAESDGAVEIDFGSDGMGCLDVVRLFAISGMLPILTLSAGENTTLSAEITRKYGYSEDLDTPIAISSGSPLFFGDTVKLTVVASGEGNTASLAVNGSAVDLGVGGVYSLVVTGDVTAVSAAVGS